MGSSVTTNFPAAPITVASDAQDDVALMGRIAAGDAASFRVLASLYSARLFAYCKRLTGSASIAEDLVQEVFLRVWTRANSYEPRAKLSTYLFHIAHNLAIDELRKAKSRGSEVDEELPGSERNPERSLLRKQASLRLEEALLLLAERQRAALLLKYSDHLSQAEVAEVLGLSEEATESLLARARKTLRALMNEEETVR
jgi:RNA polymerase sigma-70 factor, ECF subfamily